jgi:hypothetical protein
MAERKQRIMRRYLRERLDVVQSEFEVPVAGSEDEKLVESELYKGTEISLQRQESGTPMPPPRPLRRPPPQVENSNWLLAADPLVADPFAPADTEETSKKKTDGSVWGREQEQSPYESWFGRRSKEEPAANRSRYGSRQEGFSASRGYKPFSFGGGSFGQRQQEPVQGQGYSSPFGRTQEGGGGSGLGSLDLSRERTDDPNLNSGYLKRPSRNGVAPFTNGSLGSESKGQGYVPYKSLYETRRQQKPQRGGQSQQGQEYKRVNPYQEWKKQNPTQYDPRGDDAFINEFMPKSKR